MSKSSDFSLEVLGKSDHEMVQGLTKRYPAAEPVVVSVIAKHWLEFQDKFEGTIPGTNFEIEFKKSENGYTGHFCDDSDVFEFSDIPLQSLAYYVTSCFGLEKTEYESPEKLEKLTKSLDLLIKKSLLGRLKKAGPKTPKPKAPTASLPGQPAKMKAPVAPQPAALKQDMSPDKMPQAVTGTSTAKMVKQPKAAKTKQTAVGVFSMVKSEIARNCPACGQLQYDGKILKDCICFRNLSKSCTVIDRKDRYDFKFGRGWGTEEIETFLKGLKNA